ncbi:hypothetical protein [Sphingomonas psychrolutea]|uniref:Uncharacterized protein n=1 Tax=Sphingomonas psychrolutea TaxID=1259676 RepID=A0ABQ1GUD8_9SPHN|nr:hypothetical protein [Sphingomonas psychrolutea]GGA50630.1 hypothetical protein GCM10011395_21270 [Sphingomonas psychrolutea]
MTALTTKERAQVNAALCLIHDNGLDASAITRAATVNIAGGLSPGAAYGLVLNAFAGQHADLAPMLSKVTRLIGASSPETIVTYDRALTGYIATGNDAAMNALAPMIAADSMALAIRAGEMKAGDSGAAALGAIPSPAMQQAYANASTAPDVPSPTDANGYQLSAVPGAGMVGAKANLAPAHYSGFAPDVSAFNGLTLAATREAARVSAAGQSSVTPDSGSI